MIFHVADVQTALAVRSLIAGQMAVVLVRSRVDLSNAGSVLAVLLAARFGTASIANLLDEAVRLAKTINSSRNNFHEKQNRGSAPEL